MATKKNKKVTARKKSSKRKSSSKASTLPYEFIFHKKNYVWMGIGVGLIALGMILMMGGEQSSPDVWEPERIYSFTRITLAPIIILAGFVVNVIAILKK